MPILLILAALGLVRYANASTGRGRSWVLSRAWSLATGLLCLGFIFLGARSYAADVAVIETEMVDTALWVAEHVPAGEVVAAHDIGALGYFDNHTLVDLAGLVSPEVVPFIRDQARLAALLDAPQGPVSDRLSGSVSRTRGILADRPCQQWGVRSRGRARQHDRVLLALPVRFGNFFHAILASR